MTDEPDNLVLVMLRRLDAKFDRMAEDLHEIKGRLTNLEIVVGALVTADGRMQHAIDRLAERFERVERRLDLVDDSIAPP
jgi:hypothetical protein